MDYVKECVLENRINFVCEVANALGISDWSVQSILNDNLKMHQIATKFMPQLLTEEQRKIMSTQARTSRDLECLSMIITGNGIKRKE